MHYLPMQFFLSGMPINVPKEYQKGQKTPQTPKTKKFKNLSKPQILFPSSS